MTAQTCSVEVLLRDGRHAREPLQICRILGRPANNAVGICIVRQASRNHTDECTRSLWAGCGGHFQGAPANLSVCMASLAMPNACPHYFSGAGLQDGVEY
mmetsp:Transcript_427/g.1004  ORF Transcript_427/g.1004 Transcript_427/m.1004 type:complete len:100 (-) Transcript_427:172-471(-)